MPLRSQVPKNPERRWSGFAGRPALPLEGLSRTRSERRWGWFQFKPPIWLCQSASVAPLRGSCGARRGWTVPPGPELQT